MRAWEIMENRRRRTKPITIRGLHKLKKEEKRRSAVQRERRALVPIMYSNTQWRREQLELERLELEMIQLKAEIAATKAETKTKNTNAIFDMARSGIKAQNQTEQRITALAKRGLGRRKKCSTVS